MGIFDIFKGKGQTEINQEDEFVADCLTQLQNVHVYKKDIVDLELRIKFNSGLFEDCINDIVRMMELKKKVKVTFYPDDKFPKKNAAVFVSLPTRVSDLNSSSYSDQSIDVAIRESVTRKYSTFVYVIAHELSHAILHSLDHPLKDSEVATDLLVMTSGFSNVMGSGMSTTHFQHYDVKTNTQHMNSTDYGYLNRTQFNYAKGYLKTVTEKLTTSDETITEITYSTDKGLIKILQKKANDISINDLVAQKYKQESVVKEMERFSQKMYDNDFNFSAMDYIIGKDGSYNVVDNCYVAINNRNNFRIIVQNGRIANIIK